MTSEQIANWAAAGESATLELKRTTGERRDTLLPKLITGELGVKDDDQVTVRIA